jgi:hypothetical protein
MVVISMKLVLSPLLYDLVEILQESHMPNNTVGTQR